MPTYKQRLDTSDNAFDILGVPQTATDKQVRDAYHKACKETHPDKAGKDSHPSFTTIENAYREIEDEEKRREYRAKMKEGADFHESAFQEDDNDAEDVDAMDIDDKDPPKVPSPIKQIYSNVEQNMNELIAAPVPDSDPLKIKNQGLDEANSRIEAWCAENNIGAREAAGYKIQYPVLRWYLEVIRGLPPESVERSREQDGLWRYIKAHEYPDKWIEMFEAKEGQPPPRGNVRLQAGQPGGQQRSQPVPGPSVLVQSSVPTTDIRFKPKREEVKYEVLAVDPSWTRDFSGQNVLSAKTRIFGEKEHDLRVFTAEELEEDTRREIIARLNTIPPVLSTWKEGRTVETMNGVSSLVKMGKDNKPWEYVPSYVAMVKPDGKKAVMTRTAVRASQGERKADAIIDRAAEQKGQPYAKSRALLTLGYDTMQDLSDTFDRTLGFGSQTQDPPDMFNRTLGFGSRTQDPPDMFNRTLGFGSRTPGFGSWGKQSRPKAYEIRALMGQTLDSQRSFLQLEQQQPHRAGQYTAQVHPYPQYVTHVPPHQQYVTYVPSYQQQVGLVQPNGSNLVNAGLAPVAVASPHPTQVMPNQPQPVFGQPTQFSSTLAPFQGQRDPQNNFVSGLAVGGFGLQPNMTNGASLPPAVLQGGQPTDMTGHGAVGAQTIAIPVGPPAASPARTAGPIGPPAAPAQAAGA
ncbi:hypothetical protein NKR23_g9021 [Pleurostoma richardsiae]|uniref:J domain-containing protein n=1 Tax=Pleurostoma richardsiae TaxID=41990 RepID=A0AA38R599_9PEZI|nr:hypothetical protein NKR23_g9021 [Pleurostoma richardsiae]